MTEEQAISHSQYLDLVYSQSSTLYDIIPQAPRPTYDPSKSPQALRDGIIGSVQSTLEKHPQDKPTRPILPQKIPPKILPLPQTLPT